MMFIHSTISWAFVLFSFVQSMSFILSWRGVQILCRSPGGILTLGNSCMQTGKKKYVSRSFCERNCFGQWVVTRLWVLITQMCTRTLQCLQVLLHLMHNLECQTVSWLALWWEWKHWVYLIVSFCRFLPSVMTRWNFDPLSFPVGSAFNANQFQIAQVSQKLWWSWGRAARIASLY